MSENSTAFQISVVYLTWAARSFILKFIRWQTISNPNEKWENQSRIRNTIFAFFSFIHGNLMLMRPCLLIPVLNTHALYIVYDLNRTVLWTAASVNKQRTKRHLKPRLIRFTPSSIRCIWISRDGTDEQTGRPTDVCSDMISIQEEVKARTWYALMWS